MTPDVEKVAKRYVARHNIAKMEAMSGHVHWVKFADGLAKACGGALPEMRDIAGLKLYKLFNALFDYGNDFAHIKQAQRTESVLSKSKLRKAERTAKRAHYINTENVQRLVRITDMVREGYTLKNIGKAVGVTGERVRQILRKTDAPVPSVVRELMKRENGIQRAAEEIKNRVPCVLCEKPVKARANIRNNFCKNCQLLVKKCHYIWRVLSPKVAKLLMLPPNGKCQVCHAPLNRKIDLICGRHGSLNHGVSMGKMAIRRNPHLDWAKIINTVITRANLKENKCQ